ncbi:hypothetical protein K438DRAFT_1976096 [Mycena galopus ATCC 62051]|nr:hypothetical protein K438DRAFT_1976096 [Mycena galopus ATCC 62051]
MAASPAIFLPLSAVLPLNNVWYLPLSAYASFDRSGMPYNISAVDLDDEFQPELLSDIHDCRPLHDVLHPSVCLVNSVVRSGHGPPFLKNEAKGLTFASDLKLAEVVAKPT